MKVHQVILAETVGVGPDGRVGAHGIYPGFIVLSNPPQTGYPSSHTFGFLIIASSASKGDSLSGIFKLEDHTGHELAKQAIDSSKFPQFGSQEHEVNEAELIGTIVTAQMINFPFANLGTHYIIFEDLDGNEIYRTDFEVTVRKAKMEK